MKNHIEIALESLVKASLEAQNNEALSHFKNCTLAYLKEFCTIRCGANRRAGHTTAMFNMAKKFTNPLFIFPTCGIAETVMKNNGIKMKYATVNTINNLRGCECDALFVDNSSFVSQSKTEDIFSLASGFLAGRIAANGVFCLIFLQ